MLFLNFIFFASILLNTYAIPPPQQPENHKENVTFPISSPVNATVEADDLIDYYWRDYYGIIPSDALPGGVDKSGKVMYIGQVFVINQGLLPAVIYQGSKTAVAVTSGKPVQSDEFVKILCCHHIERYQWIATKTEEMQMFTNCHLVVGGHQEGNAANIGRVNHEMETIVGKVFANHMPLKGITVPSKKISEARYQQFEILAYNCNGNRNLGNSTIS